ncbi:MAG TPA: PspC domain-containing protein [Bacteroidales bacterium]|nr:PspC domain-containing protein [Bacteroidales bacterium]HSA44213.1 PspC domain-containing protein [Bacteroidales bacterium]
MKKNFNVNIAGIIFHMDEDAYEKLEHYLGQLKRHFAAVEGKDEILSDIESRIAEMLQEKLSENKQVIILEDIEGVVAILGEPSEWESGQAATRESQSRRSKRLYRDPDSKIIGGVCAGLGWYFNLDPLWIRLIFVIVTLAGFGTGLVAYLLLWALAPEARNTAEKLEMRGEKVTISNIEKSIREEFEGIRGKFNEMKDEAKEAYLRNKSGTGNFFEKLLHLFMQIISTIFKIVLVFLGLMFIAFGLFMITGLIFSMVDTGHAFHISSFGLSTISLPALFRLFLDPGMLTLGLTGLILLAGIPLILLVYFGARLIFRFRTPSRFVGIPAFSLLLAGIIICMIVALNTIRNFSQKVSIQQSHVLVQPLTKHLIIDTHRFEYPDEDIDIDDDFMIGKWNLMRTGDSIRFFGIPELEVVRAENDSFALQLIYTARGRNSGESRQRAQNIRYSFTQNDSLLILDPHFTMPVGDKIRGQEVRIRLFVPEGRNVQFREGTKVFYETRHSFDEPFLNNRKWHMTEHGLEEVKGVRKVSSDTMVVKGMM